MDHIIIKKNLQRKFKRKGVAISSAYDIASQWGIEEQPAKNPQKGR